ncbi:ATP-binding protein [Thermocoleostomius sinensis]|uniref:ATP-binding protein n=1 Tax=Thermocoleostomius sinensis A174 TaxID=2016057 RepID=A0A9E8ZG88_9CYAN|nr:ATP-binding protein [Thermocoleostomius sinensis]WAL61274.1 ATP-binding protein [Thermocoleostomius sinensis A174]
MTIISTCPSTSASPFPPHLRAEVIPMFKKATKTKSRLRLALIGPSGSGKTYSALAIAAHLGRVSGDGSKPRIAVIDSEHGSASKYADLFEFDTCELTSFHPQNYISAIRAASDYDVLIIDSLSHAWMGKDGTLEQVDRVAKRLHYNNTFAAWRDVTPLHNQLVETMLACPNHLIVTMRSKTEYVIETNDKGKSAPRKVGLAPIQRDGLEYEFDVCGELNLDNELIISKSRCSALSGQVIVKPGEQFASVLKDWLNDGAPAPKHIDRDFLLAQTEQEMARLGWSAKDGKSHLEQTYGKKSRHFLTDEELIEFSAYLQAQPDAMLQLDLADVNGR